MEICVLRKRILSRGNRLKVFDGRCKIPILVIGKSYFVVINVRNGGWFRVEVLGKIAQ